MHTAIVALAALAALAAAPPVLAQAPDNAAWDEANRELGWRVHQAVEQDSEQIEPIDIPDVIEDSKGFLIGGNEDYKPYTVPCPQDVTWIRSSTEVSSPCLYAPPLTTPRASARTRRTTSPSASPRWTRRSRT